MNPLLRIAVLLISAAILPLAYAPEGFTWLILLSWGLFIWALRDLKPTAALMAGFWWGVISFGIALSWLWIIFDTMALCLFGILACFPGLFAWVFAFAKKRSLSGVQFAIFAGLTWTALEFIRGELFWLKFPWFGLGLAFTPTPLQAWIGTYGVTLLISTALAALVLARKWPALILLFLPVAPLPNANEEAGPDSDIDKVSVTCVQLEGRPLEDLIALSKTADPKPTHLVWPEYSIPTDLRQVAKRDLATIQAFLKETDSTLTVGTQTFIREADWQNTALTLTAAEILGAHHKQHTVHFFDDGEPGTSSEAISVNGILVGTPVCFDSDFQDVVRKMTTAGARYFVAPTMDAIHWTERQHLQHGQLFQARAAENGRWIAVAASSGLTQIIDSTGHVRAQLPLIEPGVLEGTLTPRTHLTFYTRAGWLLPWVTLGAWILCLITMIISPRKRQPVPEDNVGQPIPIAN